MMFSVSTEIKPRQCNIDDSATCYNIKIDHPPNTHML
jgi:hypothetical protein